MRWPEGVALVGGRDAGRRGTELSLVQAGWPVPAGRECMRIQNGCAMTRDYMIPMRAETALFCGKWYGNAGLTAC